MSRRLIVLAIAIVPTALVSTQTGAQTAPAQLPVPLEQLQQPPDGYVYGWQIMTGAERDWYRERLQRAQTEGEREQIRRGHHWQMGERAKQMGLILPPEPQVQGQGMQQRQGKQRRASRKN